MLTRQTTRPRLLSVVVSTAAAAAIMTTAEAKKYLNVDISDDDTLIGMLVAVATQTVERVIHGALITQEITIRYRASSVPLRLHRPPVQSIDSVTSYYQGASTAEDETGFYVSGASGLRPKIMLKDAGEFAGDPVEDIEIVTTCGFGDASSDVPTPLIQAAKLILAQLYDRRDNYVDGSATPVPFDADRLMAPYISSII